MLTIDTRNVNDALPRLCDIIMLKGKIEESRNGKVRVMDGPTMVKFRSPTERVLFDADRNANPFFHLFESLWMLAGSNDVEYVSQFNKQMVSYSDDGQTFNAAYGHRWRRHFGYDQIARSIDMLRDNPYDRRVVITQWDPRADLGSTSLDIPCNQQIMPRVYEGKLNFLTTNRSNDLVWGLCGANAVHLTVLMEIMAHAIGLEVGEWVHVSNNLHIYEHHWDLAKSIRPHSHWQPYQGTQPLLTHEESYTAFLEDCADFIAGQDDDFRTEFFDGTVAPMIQGWHKWRRDGDLQGAIYDASCVEANDWRIASVRWLKRKQK
jgi:thymidylate synthase